MQDGTAFQIKDAPKLCEEILPAHFRHKNYASFIRQLNIYGFRKLPRSGSKRNCYFHPCFKRHDKEALRDIARNVPAAAMRKGTDSQLQKKTKPKLHEISKTAQCLEERLKSLEKTFEGFAKGGECAACGDCEVENTPRLAIVFLFGDFNFHNMDTLIGDH